MTTKDIPGWFSKILIGVVGALVTVVGVLVVKSADRHTEALDKQAAALKELTTAVYAGREDTAVLKSRMNTVESDVSEIKQQVKYIEAKLHKEK